MNTSIKKETDNNGKQIEYDSYPLKACTQADIEETRYHILKFHSVKNVNPKEDFEQPSRLHRKDPKNLQFQLSLKEIEQKKIDDEKKDLEKVKKRDDYLKRTGLNNLTDEQIDEKIEVENLNDDEKKQWEENRKRQKEILDKEEEKEKQMELVAPDGGARKNKRQFLKKKTKQIKVYNEDKRKLRYEEFYPWVLEDYDSKQAWVGNYEAGNNENYCLLILDNENKCFKLIPVEKFYKFTPRNKYATLTLEEAEAKMKESNSGQRWLMSKMQDEASKGERVDLRYRKLKATKNDKSHGAGDDDDDMGKKSDEDGDLDYDDEFQDDEEAPIMEGPDEDKKLIEGKMKKEMLSANNLIEKDNNENDDDDDGLDDLFEVRKIDKEGKKLRKALVKNAMNEVYESDDEENPYLSESELEEDIDSQQAENENEDNENVSENVEVKNEDNDNNDFLLSNPLKKKQKLVVKSYYDGFVILKGTKQILSQFPIGEWNPTTSVKRSISPDFEQNQTTTKKIKVKVENSDNSEIVPLTKEDVDHLLEDGPIDLTVLVRSLKSKMSKDTNSRDNLKRILKEHFILKNKMVHRKT